MTEKKRVRHLASGLLRFCSPLVLFTFIASTCLAVGLISLVLSIYVVPGSDVAPAGHPSGVVPPKVRETQPIDLIAGNTKKISDERSPDNNVTTAIANPEASPFPFLLFSPQDIAVLQRVVGDAAAQHPIHGFSELVTKASRERREATGNVCPDMIASRHHTQKEGFTHFLSDVSIASTLHPNPSQLRELAFDCMDDVVSFTGLDISTDSDWDLSRRLLEFSVAFDLMYPEMNGDQQSRYSKYMYKVGHYLFTKAQSSYKTTASLVSVETVTFHSSLYTASLVLTRLWKDRAHTFDNWRSFAKKQLDRTLLLLGSLYTDGSVPDGNYYGSSITCSVVHYLALLVRHSGLDVGKAGIAKWLKRHFKYLIYTTFPGAGKSLTLGWDAVNPTWTCGPGTQLRFIDKFVTKDGVGTAFAEMVASSLQEQQNDNTTVSARSPLYLDALHWSDSSLELKTQKRAKVANTRIFPQGGLAVYGNAFQPPLSTTAAMFGGGLYPNLLESILDDRQIKGLRWKWMVSNHHRPAAGTFIFHPRGQPFITTVPSLQKSLQEEFHPLKTTKMENTLTFQPPPRGLHMKCHRISQELGQSGECSTEFDVQHYKLTRAQNSPRKNISITANHKAVPFWRVDMTGAYDTQVAQRIQRSVVVLSPDHMVVVDDVLANAYTKQDQYVHAYFHNNQFEWRTIGRKQAAVGRHRLYFTSDIKGATPHATTGSVPSQSGNEMVSHYVKVTTPLKKAFRNAKGRFRNVYLLSGEASSTTGISIVCSSKKWIGVKLHLENGRHMLYSISLSRVVNATNDVIFNNALNPCNPELQGLSLSLSQRGRVKLTGKEEFLHEKRVSIVVHQRRQLMYCGIPKCGVSRWRRLFRRDLGIPNWYDEAAHNPETNGLTYISEFTSKQVKTMLDSPNFTSFVIVRSPYARLLSAWLDKHKNPVFKLPQTFSGFVDMLYKQRQKASEFEFHYRPMVEYCGMSDGVPYDFVGRMESIGEWGPTLAKTLGLDTLTSKNDWHGSFFPNQNDKLLHNHHAQEKLNKYYTDDLMDKVATIYAKDFKTFKYDPKVLA